METINKYQVIALDHLVEFPNDDCIFAAGYEPETGKSRIFLIFNGQGRVYGRNGHTNAWEVLAASEADVVRQKSQRARLQGIPCYSCSDSLANHIKT